MPADGHAAARIFLTRWRRKALWQTKRCFPGTDRKCCRPFALPQDCVQLLRWHRQLLASLASHTDSAQMGADRHLDFRKASVPAMCRKPCAAREENVQRRNSAVF